MSKKSRENRKVLENNLALALIKIIGDLCIGNAL